MRRIDKLTNSKILQTKLPELLGTLCPQQRSQLRILFKNLSNINKTWKPHIWISDDWYSPDGIAGFTIPITLTHPKLIALEKKYLGQCEGSTPKEFLKICSHETGHAFDNAFKLRLNKTRQKVFGKTSKRYPTSYIPNTNKNNHIHFLGDYYAQAHPDEDWAESVGYILYYPNWRSHRLNRLVRSKLELVEKVLKETNNKEAKEVTEYDLLPYKLPNITFELYLLRKKKSLGLNKEAYFKNHIDKRLSRTGEAISKKKILTELSQKTNENTWVLEKCLLDLKKGCKQQGIQLKYNHNNNSLITDLIADHIDNFKSTGRTRVYM